MPSTLPFPVNTLHPPLSHDQRRDVIHYLNRPHPENPVAKRGYTDEEIADYLGWPKKYSLNNYINGKYTPILGEPTLHDLDVSLIQEYEAVAAGGGFGKAPVLTENPSWLQSPLDFLKLLLSASLWLRVAEVLLGMLLVGAGLAKMSQRAAVVVKQIPVAGKVLT